MKSDWKETIGHVPATYDANKALEYTKSMIVTCQIRTTVLKNVPTLCQNDEER